MQPANSSYVTDQIGQFLAYSKLEKQEQIIEIGCGIGKYTFHLLEKGYNIEGLDLSPFLLSEFRKNNHKGYPVTLYNTDVLNASDVINKKFDAAIGFMVLHHLHDLGLSFKAMGDILHEHGRLVFLEPNTWNPLYYFQITFTPGMTWKSEKGVLLMHRKSFLKAMKVAGFTNIRIKRFGFFPPFIKNTMIGNKLEHFLEKFRFLDLFRPFQVIVITR
jgi:SAM-dependent methyltransferase